MRITKETRRKITKFFKHFITVIHVNNLNSLPNFNQFTEQDLMAYFNGIYGNVNEEDKRSDNDFFYPAGVLSHPPVIVALVEKLSGEGLLTLCKYHLSTILLSIDPDTFLLLTSKLDYNGLLLIYEGIYGDGWGLSRSKPVHSPDLRRNLEILSFSFPDLPYWFHFLKSPTGGAERHPNEFLTFIKRRLQSWKGMKEAAYMAYVISMAFLKNAPHSYCDSLEKLFDDLDQMIEKHLRSLQDRESLCYLCLAYARSIDREEKRKITSQRNTRSRC